MQVGHRAGRGDDLLRGAVRDRDRQDLVLPRQRLGVSGGDYHQPIAGRHPSELGDPPFAVRQPAHFLARELDQPETHRLVILVDDAGIVLLLVLLFLGLGLGVRRQEGDRVAPGRPGERRHCILT